MTSSRIGSHQWSRLNSAATSFAAAGVLRRERAQAAAGGRRTVSGLLKEAIELALRHAVRIPLAADLHRHLAIHAGADLAVDDRADDVIAGREDRPGLVVEQRVVLAVGVMVAGQVGESPDVEKAWQILGGGLRDAAQQRGAVDQ